MSSQTLFFGTRNDLVPVLETVESQRAIKYARSGKSNIPTAATFPTVTALPNLGIASHESSMASDTFLICGKTETLRPREVRGHYLFDQLLNPDTVIFTAGGLWGKEIMLNGRFGTVSTGVFASELMRLLRSAMRKRFKRIKAFYVGKEAELMLDSGKRLAVAAQSPRTFDLSRA
jgi:hypothetical protein